MRQSACLAINPITVNNFASLFDCTPVGRASDSVMGPTCWMNFNWLGPDLVLSVALTFGVQRVVFFCSGISMVLSDT